jgi:hypothetical protein
LKRIPDCAEHGDARYHRERKGEKEKEGDKTWWRHFQLIGLYLLNFRCMEIQLISM